MGQSWRPSDHGKDDRFKLKIVIDESKWWRGESKSLLWYGDRGCIMGHIGIAYGIPLDGMIGCESRRVHRQHSPDGDKWPDWLDGLLTGRIIERAELEKDYFVEKRIDYVMSILNDSRLITDDERKKALSEMCFEFKVELTFA